MSDFIRRYGQWGMVAGAAEGIGAAYCEELAGKGMNVIMVDIQGSKSESLAQQLENTFHIQTLRLVLDLASEDSTERCIYQTFGNETGKSSVNRCEETGKKTVIIPGFSNRMTYFMLTRILPRSISTSLVNRTMGKTYKEKFHPGVSGPTSN